MDLEAWQEAITLRQSGSNVTRGLNTLLNSKSNSTQVIQAAYEMQAGTYIDFYLKNEQFIKRRAKELAQKSEPFFKKASSVLDIGTGELTLVASLYRELGFPDSELFVTDLSWSRLSLGLAQFGGDFAKFPTAVVAEHSNLPFADASVDVVMSDHSIEPNGGREDSILRELFRVCRSFLILIEPDFPLNSAAGQARMKRHGYIGDLRPHIRKLGGLILEDRPMINNYKSLNRASVLVVAPPPPSMKKATMLLSNFPTVPGTNLPLMLEDGAYVSPTLGIAFPVLKGIPFMTAENALPAFSISKQSERGEHPHQN